MVKITDLIALAESFAIEASEPASQLVPSQPIPTEKSPNFPGKSAMDFGTVAREVHQFMAKSISADFGDKIGEIKHTGNRPGRKFTITTASPYSFHLYRKLTNFVTPRFPTKSRKENDQLTHSYIELLYPEHQCWIKMSIEGHEIHFQIEAL